MAIGLALAASPVCAHGPPVSFSRLAVEDGGIDVEIRLQQHDLELVLGPASTGSTNRGRSAWELAVLRYTTNRFSLLSDGSVLEPDESKGRVSREGRRDILVQLPYPVEAPPGWVTVRTGLLLEVDPDHLHLCRATGTGEEIRLRGGRRGELTLINDLSTGRSGGP